jgi:DNA-directed RNA polymerase subunit RPC12/RpoP
MSEELFYLQDKRQYVGNDLLFWAKDGKGYTTDVSKAEIYTKEKAFAQNYSRETDIPWPKEYIDERTRPAVDHQYVDIETALQDCGKELAKSPAIKNEPYRCYDCKRFMSETQYWAGACENCGCDNRP